MSKITDYIDILTGVYNNSETISGISYIDPAIAFRLKERLKPVSIDDKILEVHLVFSMVDEATFPLESSVFSSLYRKTNAHRKTNAL